MTRLRAVTAAVATVVLAGIPALAGASPAAAATPPATGECYNLTSAQVNATLWDTSLTTVPCDTPHNIEVSEVGVIPADVKYDEFAAQQCSIQSALTYAGYPNQNGKDIKNPSRVSPFYFAIKNGKNDPLTYVCAAGVFQWNGNKPYSLQRLDLPLASIVSADPASLHICAKGTSEDIYKHTLTSTSCDSKKVWKVTKSVWLGKPGKKYPGEKSIQKIMNEKCGYDATHVYTYPTADNWKNASNRAWCYEFSTTGF